MLKFLKKMGAYVPLQLDSANKLLTFWQNQSNWAPNSAVSPQVTGHINKIFEITANVFGKSLQSCELYSGPSGNPYDSVLCKDFDNHTIDFNPNKYSQSLELQHSGPCFYNSLLIWKPRSSNNYEVRQTDGSRFPDRQEFHTTWEVIEGETIASTRYKIENLGTFFKVLPNADEEGTLKVLDSSLRLVFDDKSCIPNPPEPSSTGDADKQSDAPVKPPITPAPEGPTPQQDSSASSTPDTQSQATESWSIARLVVGIGAIAGSIGLYAKRRSQPQEIQKTNVSAATNLNAPYYRKA